MRRRFGTRELFIERQNDTSSAIAVGHAAPIERRQCCGQLPHGAQRRRMAGSLFSELAVSTPSGRSDFRKTADQVHRDSTRFAAPKLPFVTARTRPGAACRSPGLSTGFEPGGVFQR